MSEARDSHRIGLGWRVNRHFDCTSTIGLEATVSSLLHRFERREVTLGVIFVMIVPLSWDCAGSNLGRPSALAKGRRKQRGLDSGHLQAGSWNEVVNDDMKMSRTM